RWPKASSRALASGADTPGALARGVASGSGDGVSGMPSSIGAASDEPVLPSPGSLQFARIHEQGRSSDDGCRLRDLRQAPGLRHEGELLPPAQPAALEP